MLRHRLKAGLAISVTSGCAFAVGLLARGAASDKAVLGGVLVAVAASAFVALFAWMSQEKRA